MNAAFFCDGIDLLVRKPQLVLGVVHTALIEKLHNCHAVFSLEPTEHIVFADAETLSQFLQRDLLCKVFLQILMNLLPFLRSVPGNMPCLFLLFWSESMLSAASDTPIHTVHNPALLHGNSLQVLQTGSIHSAAPLITKDALRCRKISYRCGIAAPLQCTHRICQGSLASQQWE